jgi:hypothetical protein
VAAKQVREDSEQRLAAIDRLAEEARLLIPTVLATLANDDYRGVEQIEVYVPRRGPGRIFEKDRLVKAGAYRNSSYEVRESTLRTAGTAQVRLLSSGRIVVGSGSNSVAEFVQKVLNHEGLGRPGLWTSGEPYSINGLTKFVESLRAIAEGRNALSCV